MNIKQRITGAVKFLFGSPLQNNFFNVVSSGFKRRQSAGNDPASNFTGWAYFAIDKIGERVSAIDFELYNLKKNGEVEEVEDHELLALLHRANAMMTKTDLFYLVGVFMKIWGAAPLYVEKIGSKPYNLYPMRPDLLKMKQAAKSNLIGWEFKVGSKIERYEADEVVYIRKPDPSNPTKAYSQITKA